MSGQLIGNRYRVLRKIGEGGMAVVHLAVDEKLGRDVAIKILRERYEHHDEIRIRFQHEARAISSFDHSNILKIYDFSGEESRQLWIVTELIHGRNLAQILETTPSGWLHPAIAASIVREICRALGSAHEHGVVHRDVKPENVMITHQGTVKLMDFGIAKIQRITNMTQTGIFMGSPSYMSPEQVRGRDVDNRSDIYSLGVLFYELITGKLPFTGSSTADIAMRILNGDFAHPRFIMAGIPDALDQCIVQCMALTPENRPQSIEVVGEKIDAMLQAMGLESSMQELERCFKDPKAYGDRLARILKVSQVKQEATMLIDSNQRTALGHWNNEAINSPIPRPDISGSNLPTGAQRKDHLLPPRSVPHFTKRQLTPELISAHLPERRHQQRPMEATRLASGSKFGQYPVKASQQITPPPMNQPKRSSIQQRQPQVGQRNVNQYQNREVRPVSRVLPATPKRNQKPVRYVVKETYYPESSSGSFAKLVLAILLLSCAALLWFGNRKENLNLLNWISLIEKPKRPSNKPAAKNTVKNPTRIKPDNKPTVTSSASQNLDKETSKTRKPESIEPLPKYAEKTKSKLQNQDKLGVAPVYSQNLSEAASRPSIKSNPPKPSKIIANKITSDSKKPSTQDNRVLANTVTTVTADSSEDSEILPPKKNLTKTDSLPTKNNPNEDLDVANPIQKTQTKPAANKNEKYQVSKKVQISISSTPAAELFVNGRRFGTTNNNGSTSEWIDVASGKNRIELRRAGFATKIETIVVSTADKQTFGPYVLNRGASTTPTSSLYKLTLATNLPPVEVTIINIETNAKQTVSLSQASKTIPLERGIYEVTMNRKGDIRKRRLDFSGNVQQLTFSVDFKEASN
jgi:serine/threonine protein kinase